MGALLADAPAGDCEVLYRFAEKIGLASNSKTTTSMPTAIPKFFGKKIGGDILLRQENVPHGFGLGANA